ncbi:hypothetical protein, conserved [Trypanosoma brucei brucei TREU927]|uniref:Uncharacterized protein n=1 Tax=Trypanosoma brucei brucei (strain 927/4 GUTat10.1) TaxID=185431 RepID=Q583Z7_TRYB2|nr:hypothetical protein, conserved [Trypanosoma brucei brucei TREU927]AAX79823.1 hypothetical protein, conserved [Trypanosoma brucei]AAZ10911.1 hypothetical protein, conserved [Trypanosoma brucei brucei TREU927]
MVRIVPVVFAAISVVLVDSRMQETDKEALSTLKQIDCVVKKLNWMINVTEDLLLRTRVHAEEVYEKRYSAEEQNAAWRELFLRGKPFMKKEKGDKMKEILNEMESVFEGESYLRKKFDLSVSYMEEKAMDVVRTGTRYAATMEEMYRVGSEAVRMLNNSHGFCRNNGIQVTCDGTLTGRDVSDIITEFDSSRDEHVDLRFHNGTAYSTGGRKLADRVDSVSTSHGHIFKHRGIRGNLGRDKVLANRYGLVEDVNVTRVFKSFLPHLKEINDVSSEIEVMLSKLSERASRIDTLSDKLHSLFSSLMASSV